MSKKSVIIGVTVTVGVLLIVAIFLVAYFLTRPKTSDAGDSGSGDSGSGGGTQPSDLPPDANQNSKPVINSANPKLGVMAGGTYPGNYFFHQQLGGTPGTYPHILRYLPCTGGSENCSPTAGQSTTWGIDVIRQVDSIYTIARNAQRLDSVGNGVFTYDTSMFDQPITPNSI